MVVSTYGERVHPGEDPAEVLGTTAECTVKRGGTLVTPAFAVGRAQQLLYYFWTLKRAGRLASISIFLDSPMAADATDMMRRHPHDHQLDHPTCREAFGIAEYTNDVEASKAITASRYPKIVIAASGMATGGACCTISKRSAPIRDPRSCFQVSRLPEHAGALQQGAKDLKIHGDWVPIKAEAAQLDMPSAHADSNELMRWLSGFNRAPRRVFIVHGEPETSEALRVRIERELGRPGVVPRQDQEFRL